LDFDHQANLTDQLGVYDENNKTWSDWVTGRVPNVKDLILKVTDNISIIPSGLGDADLSFELVLQHKNVATIFKKVVEGLKRDYDLIVCDCPPALGQHVTGVYLAVDTVIAPVNPDKFCYASVSKMLHYWEKINKEYANGESRKIKVVINRFDPRLRAANERVLRLFEDYRSHVSTHYIKASSDFGSALEAGKHLWEIKKSNAADEVDVLVREELNINLGEGV
jgi:chromosome partitioning protein